MKFGDSNGNPSIVSKELLEIAKKMLPSVLQNLVEDVVPNYTTSILLPSGRNEREFKCIDIIFEKPIGKKEIFSINIGILKRVNGPGTGYVCLNAMHKEHSKTNGAGNSYSYDSESTLFKEGWKPAPKIKYFYDSPEDAAKELFDKFLAKYFHEARGEIVSKSLGIIEKMKPRFKNYEDFLSEDFASVGSVSGMGDVSAPTADSYGSGDTFPSLGGIQTVAGVIPKKKKKKKKKKK